QGSRCEEVVLRAGQSSQGRAERLMRLEGSGQELEDAEAVEGATASKRRNDASRAALHFTVVVAGRPESSTIADCTAEPAA
ncbi:hypothetical protein, partial [Sinorhizobium sp. Sb3]|uniref:hypothetical protein n=1 Tax=Sinorhizobium sp. Sb3 TaxID=1358417 RepID=UPI001AECBFF6